MGRIWKELAVKDLGLNSAFEEKKQALAKWRKVEPSIRRAHDDKMKAPQLADSLLSEVEEVKAISQHEKDQLLHSLEKVHADCHAPLPKIRKTGT